MNLVQFNHGPLDGRAEALDWADEIFDIKVWEAGTLMLHRYRKDKVVGGVLNYVYEGTWGNLFGYATAALN